MGRCAGAEFRVEIGMVQWLGPHLAMDVKTVGVSGSDVD